MRSAVPRRLLGLSRTIRLATAMAVMVQLLVVIAAPLGERAAENVAAVHVEQAGTRAHHAHGELCATCVAMHLAATPARASTTWLIATATPRPRASEALGQRWVGLAVLLPRAPPV